MARDLKITRSAPRKCFLLKAGLSIFFLLLIQNPLRQPDEIATYFQAAAVQPQPDQKSSPDPDTDACLVAVELPCADE